MRGAVFVAIAAAIGNLLQGWDNATIAGNFCILNISIFRPFSVLWLLGFTTMRPSSNHLMNKFGDYSIIADPYAVRS